MKNSKAISLLALLASPFLATQAGATVIWNGPSVTYSKIARSNWTLPENQDRITPLVWLTRANTQGMFNIARESSYTTVSSPLGTEWAYGTTADFASLIYTNWETWTGGPGSGPPSTLGRDAVVHLIDEDIYLDIKFTAWGYTTGSVSYVRSSEGIPEPSGIALLGIGTLLLGAIRNRRHPESPQQNHN